MKKTVFDLILLDVMMPDINGYEVTRQLKSNQTTSSIPIILVTSLEGTENKVKGLEAGADEFLNRPVNREELLARINSVLRLKQDLDQLEEQVTQRTTEAEGSTGVIAAMAQRKNPGDAFAIGHISLSCDVP